MENRKLRIAVVEPNGSGGLIHYAYQLCTALAGAGADVTLLTGRQYELADLPHNFSVNNLLDLWSIFDPRAGEKSRMGIWQRTLYRFLWTLRRAQRAFRLLSAWVQLTQALLKMKPDVVQFSKIHFPFESIFLAAMRRRGLVLTQICHEFEQREGRQGLLASLNARAYADAYRHFSAIFFHARENSEKFLSLFPFVAASKAHVIPHGNSGWLLEHFPQSQAGEPLRQRYGLRTGPPVVLFFGLLAPSKGIEDLIEAFDIVRKASDSQLVIAGYPTKKFDLAALQSRISALDLEHHVVLDLRYILLEEVGALMRLATVVVYPYRSSTQSGALQVAYTFGRPVVATIVGGLPEAVEHGKSGLLVPPESPPDLAKAVLKLVTDDELAGNMGEYAGNLSRTRFSWGTVAQQIIGVYEQVLERESA